MQQWMFTVKNPNLSAQIQEQARKSDNVVFSSHLGASTVEAQRETSTEIARVVSSYLLGGDF